MTTINMRSEREIMQELALIAVKKHANFINDGSQYTLPNGRGENFVYNAEFLDIRFVEDGRKDSVVKFISTLAPSTLPFYCLLSELNEEE
ncbi:hypothetical protein HYE60_05925 [Aggregatibacter actinomycetemcomitans]|uniref:hypothetical protein n=1 Tax=Aggregatibacter actinomycetemcomitans TaxID=714 RepID=UPI00197C8E45|nr:hypothetical protein [Aggregatibacter actinomycetemcomitans]MBN6074786.1 hypothetical protein [Aggregatibacter actinomycetemcomitans]